MPALRLIVNYSPVFIRRMSAACFLEKVTNTYAKNTFVLHTKLCFRVKAAHQKRESVSAVMAFTHALCAGISV